MTTNETGVAVPTATAWVRFDRWAGTLLMLLAVIAGIASIVVASATREPILNATILGAGLATAAIYVAATYGLSAGRTWARPVAVALLWLIMLTGLIDLVIALMKGGLTVPLVAIAAAFVVRMRPAERPTWPEGQRRPVAAVLALVVLTLLLPSAADYLMRPGNSPFSVPPAALAMTAMLRCAPSDSPSTEIRATATWSWTQHEFLPHGQDALAFRWRIVDNDETPETPLYAELFLRLKDAPGTGFTSTDQGSVNPGREGASGPFWLGDEGTSGDVVRVLAQEAEAHWAFVEPVVIEVGRQQLRDDTFLMVLAPDPVVLAELATSGYEHATVTFDVAYVHAARWTVWSDPVSCSW